MSTTTTVTAIELTNTAPIEPQNSTTFSTQRHGETVRQRGPIAGPEQTSGQIDEDPILEASRLADTTVPDGGYGWVVVAGCAVLTWWFTGMVYCWGVLQNALIEEGLSSTSTLSFVGSMSTGIFAAAAILNARVLLYLGTRRTGILGVVLLSAGDLASSFAVHDIAALFITAGLVMGFGIGFCSAAVTAAPPQYFRRKRGIANGLVYAGGGLGGAVMSLVLDSLIRRCGPAWTYRALSLMVLVTGLPAAWVIVERMPLRRTKLVEWHLFRDTKFVLVFLASGLATFPLLVPPFFLPLYVTRMMANSNSSAASASAIGAALLAAFNFSSAVGRILCGFCCDFVGPINTLFMTLLLGALSMLALWPASTKVASLAVFAVINGAANGGFFSTMPTVVGNVFGSQRVAVAFGMTITGWAAGYLMGAPIAGYLLEAYGGAESGLKAFRPAMFYAGSMALAAAGLVAAMRLYMSRSLRAKL